MFGTTPIVPMVLTLITSLGLCIGLTFPKYKDDRETTTFGSYLVFLAIHLILWGGIFAILAEIFYVVIPETQLSPSEYSAFYAEQVQHSKNLALWMVIVSLTGLGATSVFLLFKRSLSILWVLSFAVIDFIGWQMINVFLGNMHP